MSEEERAVLRRAIVKHGFDAAMDDYPSEITEAAKAYNPSVVTRYVFELAQLFHKFYDTCKIKGEAAEVINSRLALCEAVKTVFRNMLDLLKVEAPEKM